MAIGQYAAGDGTTLKYRSWIRGDSGALVYLHGIESHSEWFSECAEKICAAGISVYALDRRGSGMNNDQRGHCSDYHLLIKDVADFAEGILRQHPRLHLAGLSWGGKLAVAVDIFFPGVFSSLSLISPGIFPRVAPGASERLKIALDVLLRPGALHPIPITDEMFTSLPARLEYIRKDPLRLHHVTAAFYLQSVRIDRILKKHHYQWSAPTQLLLAENDAIVDNRRLQEMFRSLQAQPKEALLYEGCNHSLQFEKPEQVADDVARWIKEVTGK